MAIKLVKKNIIEEMPMKIIKNNKRKKLQKDKVIRAKTTLYHKKKIKKI